MQLKLWLKSQHLSDAEGAKRLRTSVETLRKWKAGRLPRPAKVVLIYRVSKGMVGPADLYKLPKLPAEAPQADAA